METNDGIARSGRPTHVIPAHLLGQAVKRIEAANRRLASAGAAERFTYDVTREMRTDTRFHGGAAISTAFEVAVITLSVPIIATGGWRFLAAVDQAEAGLITRTAPDVDLSGWRPEDMRCEHCGHTRARKHTYLIEHTDGHRMQIGSTCLAPFLGVSPAGLWVLGADLLDDEYDVDLWLTAAASAAR